MSAELGMTIFFNLGPSFSHVIFHLTLMHMASKCSIILSSKNNNRPLINHPQPEKIFTLSVASFIGRLMKFGSAVKHSYHCF